MMQNPGGYQEGVKLESPQPLLGLKMTNSEHPVGQDQPSPGHPSKTSSAPGQWLGPPQAAEGWASLPPQAGSVFTLLSRVLESVRV